MYTTALSKLKKFRFVQCKKFVAVVSIMLLLFTSYAPPAIAVAQKEGIDLAPVPNPSPEQVVRPAIERTYIAESETTNDVLKLADLAFTVESAQTRLPVEVQELEQDDFSADGVVTVTVNNPDRDTFTTRVLDSKGQETSVHLDIEQTGTETEIKISGPNQLVPGTYTVEIIDSAGEKSTQNFTWGVLALNTDKSFYKPGERAEISMAVLDDKGDMVCDANVELHIINDKTKVSNVLSTRGQQIVVNKECHSKQFTLTPDYQTSYVFGTEGPYTMKLKASTLKGSYEIEEKIEVKNNVPFDVKRTSATRLYPPLEYPMQIEFTAQEDFTGTITETVPESFIITPADANKTYDTTKTVYLDKNDPAADLNSHVLGAATSSLHMPFDGNFSITQGFGMPMTDVSLREFYAKYGLSGHDGIDFALPMGTPLYAVDDGNILFSGPGDYGITIVIQHSWGRTYYGHLSKTNIDANTSVKKGSLIGYSGNTGESTGPHLHFGMKPENPDLNNGYAGKIDPLPYLHASDGVTQLTKAFNLQNIAAVLSASDAAAQTAPTPTPTTAPTAETSLNANLVEPTVTPEPVASTAAVQNAVSPTPTPSAAPVAPIIPAKPFTIVSDKVLGEVADSESAVNGKVKVLQWEVSLKKGEKTTLSYTYEVPKVSPQFYLLGTVKVFDEKHTQQFEEGRKWQLAADSVGTDWYDYSYQYRKSITIDKDKVGNAPDAWCNDASGITCNTSWTSRKKITFNNQSASSSLTNFPVLVQLDSNNINYSDTQADGDDLRFVDASDNTVVLDHEIETFNEEGTSIIWVEVPTIDAASSQDYIWMYYNNASATSGENATGTWDSSYTFVYHMDESGTTLNDSTSTPVNITTNGPVQDSTGIIGAGQTFDGTNDYATTSTSPGLPTGDFTYSIWTEHTDVTDGTLFEALDGAAGDELRVHMTSTSTMALYTDGTTTNSTDKAYLVGNRDHIVYVRSGGTNTLYVNGQASAQTVTDSTALSFSTCQLLIGADADSTCVGTLGQYYGGTMDELRISNDDRSADYILASYRNESNSFSTIGPELDQNFDDVESSNTSTSSEWCNDSNGITCDSNWTSRKKITINNSVSGEHLTDFPLLVALDSGDIDRTKTQADGDDLRFVDPDNNTVVLDHEIENYDETGTDYVWVEVPQINANSTTDYIWMYYNNASATSGENVSGTWNSGYAAVYHMDESSGTTNADSTSNANNGTKLSSGEPAAFASGPINAAQDFDGSNDYVRANDHNSLDLVSGTMSVWFNRDGTGSWQTLIAKGASSSTSAHNYAMQISPSNTIDLQIGNGSSGQSNGGDAVMSSTSSNYYYAGTWDGSNKIGYLNGAFDFSDPQTVTPAGNTSQLRIGEWGGNVEYMNGVIDEVRISNVARSADWIEAEYRSGTDAMNSFGTEETYPGGGGGEEEATRDAWCSDASGITCNTSWTVRKKITINNSASAENLTNFPLLVALDSSDIDRTKTQSDGDDLRFVDPSDSTTVLDHEIENYDESGTDYVWVEVPQIDANSTTDYIWMYYNNSSATSGANASGVWNSAYKGVWHLGESGDNVGFDYLDSTSNASHGQGGGGTAGLQPAQFSAGKIGAAQSFTPNTDFIDVPSVTYTNDITASVWFKGANQTAADWNYFMLTDNQSIEYGTFGDTTTFKDTFEGPSISGGDQTDDTWHLATGVISASAITIYIDGAYQNSTTYAGGHNYGARNFEFGGNGSSRGWDGELDEIRISNVARSADWVEAEYLSMNDSMNTFGAEDPNWCNDSTGVTCDTTWTTRKKITINNSASAANLTDFPFLVKLDSTRIDYSLTMSNGEDIRFVDPNDPTTVLAHEIESWNESGTSYVWVKIPQIDATSTTDYIMMYYDNAAATDGQAVTSVWNSAYQTVWHMSETSTFNDSTSVNNDGTDQATVTQVTGQIGTGQDFDGTADWVDSSVSGLISGVNAYTFEMWVEPDACSDDTLLKVFDGTSIEFNICPNGTGDLGIWHGTGNEASSSTGEVSIGTSTWQHIAVVYNGSGTIQFYVDGVATSMVDSSLSEFSTTGAMTLSTNSRNTPAEFFDGGMDEVRVSNTNRSADWIEAIYLSEDDSMATYGTAESYSTESSIAANDNEWCADSDGGVTCNTSWATRKKVEIIGGNASAAQTDFPLLIKLDGTKIDYTKTQSDGDDIRFFASDDNSVALPHEVESWNESGNSYVWVKVPEISTSNNSWIWMYYDNASASSGADATNVWDSGFEVVHHFEEASSGSCSTTTSDSTSLANTGTCVNTPTYVSTGKVGNALSFAAASSEYINNNTAAGDIATGNVTYSVWFNLTSTFTSAATVDMNLFSLGDSGSNNDVWMYLDQTDGRLAFGAYNGSSGVDSVSNQTSWTLGTWYHAVGTFNASTGAIALYVNGVKVDADTIGSPYRTTPNAAQFEIARAYDASSYFGGIVEEVQVSNSQRDINWSETTYLNQQDWVTTFGDAEGVNGDTLTDYPVLISLTSDTDLSTKAQGDGDDIVFTSSDGITKIPHEIESYSSGTLVAWVKPTSISSGSDTEIYMYYGNPAASSQQQATSVWDSSYESIYHLGESSTGGVDTWRDSTSNGNHNSTVASAQAPNQTTGLIGSGQDFTAATDDHISFDALAGYGNINSTQTVSLWYKTSSNPGAQTHLFTLWNAAFNDDSEVYFNGSGSIGMGSIGDSPFGYYTSTTVPTAGSWHYVTYTWNGTNSRMYIDGTLRASSTTSPFASGAISWLFLGAYCSSTTGCNNFNGQMDESRFSSTNRSAEWIETDYNNQSSPSTFYAVGSEETEIYAPTNDELMRHGKFFDSRAAEQPFNF